MSDRIALLGHFLKRHMAHLVIEMFILFSSEVCVSHTHTAKTQVADRSRSAHQLLKDYQERYPALRVAHGGVSAGGLSSLHLAGRCRGLH
jgi:hypothetical protein